MEVEAIAGIVGTSPAAAAMAYAREQHLSPAATALVVTRARELATAAERAVDGDPIARARLAAEADRATPDLARGLEPALPLPLPLPHAAATHEPGKGDRIDVYD